MGVKLGLYILYWIWLYGYGWTFINNCCTVWLMTRNIYFLLVDIYVYVIVWIMFSISLTFRKKNRKHDNYTKNRHHVQRLQHQFLKQSLICRPTLIMDVQKTVAINSSPLSFTRSAITDCLVNQHYVVALFCHPRTNR